jgi:hypothetical protein
MQSSNPLLVFLLTGLLALSATGHFVLNAPPSLGFDDVNEGKAPCGGFDPKQHSTETIVTDFPVAGYPISVLSTHSFSTWEIRAALLNNTDTDNWTSLVPLVAQSGVGTFCFPQTPGVAAWVGLEAVLQVTQKAADGALYQVCPSL